MSREIYFSRDFSITRRSCRVLKTGFLFCAILIFTDLTKKDVGGILKEMEVPDSVGRLRYLVIKPS